MSWETSFVAMSAALGDPVDDAVAMLPAARDQETPRLVAALKHASKTHRAQALAAALGAIARDVADADLGEGAS